MKNFSWKFFRSYWYVPVWNNARVRLIINHILCYFLLKFFSCFFISFSGKRLPSSSKFHSDPNPTDKPQSRKFSTCRCDDLAANWSPWLVTNYCYQRIKWGGGQCHLLKMSLIKILSFPHVFSRNLNMRPNSGGQANQTPHDGGVNNTKMLLTLVN